MKIQIVICVLIALLLQLTLASIWEPLKYIDFPLICVVYFALQRDAVRAVVTATIVGLGIDMLIATGEAGALLGANGFAKTVVAYAIAWLGTRILLDNPLMRIPVLAGSTALNAVIYYGLHRMFARTPAPFAETLAFSLIATTAIGTLLFYFLDAYISDHANSRRLFASRRRAARRGGLLGRRKN